MNDNLLFKKLKKFGLNAKKTYMAEAFSRNIGLLTRNEQNQLANANVAIPGMGGVGGLHLITMVRTGVGKFHLSDFDTFEAANVNRQFGARVPDFGRFKLETMKEHALSINPFLEIKEFPDGVNNSNIDDFLDGVQVVLDGIDFFAFETRRLVFNRAQEKGIYVVTAGPIGFSSAMLIFSPNEGMSFDEYFNIVEGMPLNEKYLAFAMGLTPKPTHIKYMNLSKINFDSKAGPSLGIACQICSGMAGAEAVKIILKRGRIKPVPYFFQFDTYSQKYSKGKLHFGSRNPIHRLKMSIAKSLIKKNRQRYKPSAPDFPTVEIGSDYSLPDEVIQYIIKAGIQAPSGDNAQPWKFLRKDDTVSLYLDEDADHSFFNINQMASIISCGAVLENMKIAASMFGLKADIVCLPSDEKNIMASMKFTRDKIVVNPLSFFIWERHTNRTLYKKAAISPNILNEMQKAISDFSDVKLHFVTGASKLSKLAKIIYNVDRIRTEHKGLHEHLGKMIRYTHDEAVEKRDGLPLKNLEAGDAGELFLKTFRPWRAMNIANKIGMGRMIALHSFLGIVNSSGAALLTVNGKGNENFLKGGMALEKIWLNFTQKELSFQPMTAITLFWHRWQNGRKEDFSENHQKLLTNVWKEYEELFSDVDFANDSHIMLFRFGIGKEIQCGTYRKDISSFLI